MRHALGVAAAWIVVARVRGENSYSGYGGYNDGYVSYGDYYGEMSNYTDLSISWYDHSDDYGGGCNKDSCVFEDAGCASSAEVHVVQEFQDCEAACEDAADCYYFNFNGTACAFFSSCADASFAATADDRWISFYRRTNDGTEATCPGAKCWPTAAPTEEPSMSPTGSTDSIDVRDETSVKTTKDRCVRWS